MRSQLAIPIKPTSYAFTSLNYFRELFEGVNSVEVLLQPLFKPQNPSPADIRGGRCMFQASEDVSPSSSVRDRRKCPLPKDLVLKGLKGEVVPHHSPSHGVTGNGTPNGNAKPATV